MLKPPNITKTRTKDEIIEILSRTWPLSLKEIFYKIKKEYGKSITYQAVFKAINELLKENILLKENKHYKINIEWANNIRKFSANLIKNYTVDNSSAKPLIEVTAGISKIQDAFEAGKEAAEKAFEDIIYYKSKLQLALVFSSVCYESNFSSLMNGIKSVLGELPLVGITTFGEIHESRHNDSVVVILFAADKENFSVQTSMIDINAIYNTSHNNTIPKLIQYSKELVANMNLSEGNFAFLFFPGPSKNNNMINIAPEFTDFLKKFIPSDLAIIGGVAADDGKLNRTYQFYNYKAYSDAVIFVNVITKVNFSITAEHGYLRANSKEYKFKLKNNLIKDIAVLEKGLAKDRLSSFNSSIDVYTKEIGVSKRSLGEIMPYFKGPGGRFKEWIKLTAFSKKSSPYLLSYPFSIENNMLAFTGILDEKENMIMMDTTSENLVNSFKSALNKSIKKLNEPPQIILVFPCAIFNVMIITAQNEIKSFKLENNKNGQEKEVHIVGAYVNGEIGPYDLKNIDFCNGSVTCLAIGRHHK